jgi:glycosyltransferase involved in cell wall biosynthesis
MRIVFFSEIKWQYLRTRKQQLLRRFPKEWKILFLEPYVVGRPNSFRLQREDNVCFVTLPYFKNFPQRWIRHLLSYCVMRALVIAIATIWAWVLMWQSGFRRPELLMVSNIYAAPLVRWFAKGKPVIYDCNDHHLSFALTPPWAERYFVSTCRRANRIVCVSASLAETIPPESRGKVLVIGNGVEYARFAGNATPAAELLQFRPRPILLFVGAIYEWIDFDLLAQIAASHPNKMLVLIGPVARFLQTQMEKLLHDAPNVKYLGEVPYDHLPAYLAAADVGIMPFIKTQHTQVLNPGKLYLYLAAGKPVVSTAVSPELMAMADEIFLAEEATTFVAQIDRALAVTATGVEARRRVAAANDWQEKTRQMVALIEESHASANRKKSLFLSQIFSKIYVFY